MKNSYLLACLALGLSAFASHAAGVEVLAKYVTPASGTLNQNITTTHVTFNSPGGADTAAKAGITASNLAGRVETTTRFGGASGPIRTAFGTATLTAPAMMFSGANTGATATTSNAYFQFDVTAATPGDSLDLSSLTFDWGWAADSAITAFQSSYAVSYSTDGSTFTHLFTSSVQSTTPSATGTSGTFGNQSVDLSALPPAQRYWIRVRAADNTTTVSQIPNSFQNVTLNGETVTLPNPTLYVAATATFTNNGDPLGQYYTIPLSNFAGDGTTPLTISNVTATGANAAEVSSVGWPDSIAAGAADFLNFIFTPAAAGLHHFNLEVVSNDASAVSPRVIAVTVEVKDPFIALVGSTSRELGAYTTSSGPQASVITVNNDGLGQNLVIDPVTTVITGSGYVISSLPGPIAPGASGDIGITFTPGAAASQSAGTLTIASNDYNGTKPVVNFNATVLPPAPCLAFDFGTASSALASGFERFTAAEGANKQAAGLKVTISSKNNDLIAGSAAGGKFALGIDYAKTTFTGGPDNYISVQIQGLKNGTLDLYSLHDYADANSLPIDVLFGPAGGPFNRIADDLARGGSVSHSTTVQAGTTYELRILEQGNANVAYIAGLVLSGSAVPGGTFGAGYGAYVTDAGLNPATTGASDVDADLDGAANGIEWVIGGSVNGTAPDTDKLPLAIRVTADPDNDTVSSDYLRFSYRRTDVAAANVATAIAVEYGSDLTGWTPAVHGTAGVVTVVTNDGVSAGIDLVDVYLPVSLATGGKLFARLNVAVGEL